MLRTSKVEMSKEVMDDPDSEVMLKDFYIPDYILVPGFEIKNSFQIPACPVIVFINSMSGGQLGGELLMTYRALLNENQVFDVGENSPDLVLQQLYRTLGMLKGSGDVLANQIENHLRIIVAGGDGTASWLLGVVSDLKLPKPPPIATVPLGTGNNLPFSFGWGKKNPGTDQASVKSFLLQVKRANEMKIDSWHILMKMKVQQGHYFEPVGPLDLPPSFHEFPLVFPEDKLQMDGWHTFRGGFWNYFSMGMDAQVSYSFHSQRKLHPEKFKNQLTNQSIYVKLGCTQGWFCTPFYPSFRNIAQLVKVKILKKEGQWEDLIIPTSIRAIVCLNLPSFSGGLDPWGSPNKKKLLQRELTPPYIDDGLIEIVGFRDAWHGLVLLTPKGHGTRLAQANRVLFEFKKGVANHAYMRIDGEPWKQPLPLDDSRVIIDISHFGQVSMLANPHCRSKSIYDTSSLKTCGNDKEHSVNSAKRKKFGAASTFKFQNRIDKVENLS